MLIYRISSGVGRWIGSVHVNDWFTSVIDSQNRVHTGFRQKRSYHYHCSCRHFQYHLELPDHHLAEVIYSADDLSEFVWRSVLLQKLSCSFTFTDYLFKIQHASYRFDLLDGLLHTFMIFFKKAM